MHSGAKLGGESSMAPRDGHAESANPSSARYRGRRRRHPPQSPSTSHRARPRSCASRSVESSPLLCSSGSHPARGWHRVGCVSGLRVRGALTQTQSALHHAPAGDARHDRVERITTPAIITRLCTTSLASRGLGILALVASSARHVAHLHLAGSSGVAINAKYSYQVTLESAHGQGYNLAAPWLYSPCGGPLWVTHALDDVPPRATRDDADRPPASSP
ncbi:hypothetical protein C8Q79DRAFT_638841 [Trametes meyenii]|nr:hypothetical protein C8Q79DRAFT_638841 [Trametes meyenii]